VKKSIKEFLDKKKGTKIVPAARPVGLKDVSCSTNCCFGGRGGQCR
jgi:hypothetical protein